ncbi:MAG: hypothetical protein ACLQU4_07365 [Limisphaerales bacterium]
MNAPETIQPNGKYVLLFVTIPGLGCIEGIYAAMMGCLLEETIIRSLKSAGFFLESPLLPQVEIGRKQALSTFSRLWKLAHRMMRVGSESPPHDAKPLAVIQARVRASTDAWMRLNGEPPSSTRIDGDRMLFRFFVSDCERSLPAIMAELKRVAFLEWSEFGSYDSVSGSGQRFFPQTPIAPLDPGCIQILKDEGLLP